MAKRFYSHLIEIQDIFIALDELEFSEKEKIHLGSLVDSALHNLILDEIFSHLEAQDRQAFLNHLNTGNHDKIWLFLNSKVEDIEGKIKTVSKELKIKLHEDIKEAKRIKDK